MSWEHAFTGGGGELHSRNISNTGCLYCTERSVGRALGTVILVPASGHALAVIEQQ